MGCFGGACYGGGCFGGCIGGGIGAPVLPGNAVPVNPTAPSTTTPNKTKQTSIQNAAPATLIVTVPADARLTIDDEATTSTSTQRVFVSPALNPGQDYHYTLKAEFVKDGKQMTISKEVEVRAGSQTRINMDAETEAGVVSR
jgi:uncharacterized protein (TIGR03000 family)